MAADRRKRYASACLAAALFAAGPALAQTAPQAGAPGEDQPPVPRPQGSATDCTDGSGNALERCRPDGRDEFGRPVVFLPDILVDLFPAVRPPQSAPGMADRADAPAASTAEPGAGALPGINAQAAPANPTPVPAAPPRALAGDYIADEVLVTVAGDDQTVQDIAAAFNLDIRAQRLSTLLGVTVVRYGIPDGRPVALVLAQLAGDARTLASAPNHIHVIQQAATIGNYAFQSIGLEQGGASGENVRVAVIDTALDDTHPALSGVIAGAFDAMPGTPVKDRDHGTSIAGLIAGVGPVHGIAPGAAIYHARAFEGGRSSVDVLLAALDWAVEQRSQIVNMSFVGPRNELMERACAAALSRGIVLVAAVGNNGPRAPYGYPAAYDGVIAVTATDEKDRLMADANRGPYVFIAAPGVDMLAPVRGGVDVVTGTSFAAAIVSGAVANLLHAAPGQHAGGVGDVLARTATDLGIMGRDDEFGFGLVNMRSVLPAAR